MNEVNDMFVCPYDRSHLVSRKRMGQHLVKCEASHPHIILRTCFYDFLHRVPPEKFEEHLENCPSQFKFRARFSFGGESSTASGSNTETIFMRRSGGTGEKKSSTFTFAEFKGKDAEPKKETKGSQNMENWDSSSSSTDTADKAKGASSSFTATSSDYSGHDDTGSTHTDSSANFPGDDSVDQEGYVMAYSKRKPKRKNKM